MDIQHFFVAGINYKKSDVSVRGSFSVAQRAHRELLNKAKELNYKDVFVLSTCNRTEIYGVSYNVDEMIDLLCEFSGGSKEVFLERGYIKNSCYAAEHLFNVSAGLDSQLLGDYEIVGQLKNAVKVAKEEGTISSFFERLTNSSFKASKEIKNATKLSGGAVSVAFAAIQYLKSLGISFSDKKFLLVGAGEIGKNTCKNLIDYLGVKDITIVNRTNQRAKEVASELGKKQIDFANYKQTLKNTDVVIVATNASKPVLQAEDIAQCGSKILIDLSVPNNIDTDVCNLPGVRLVNVDDLSKINDHTLDIRKKEIPKAKIILNTHAQEFYEWYKQRKQAPLIRAAKQHMHELNNINSENHPECTHNNEENVHKLIKNMAVKLKAEHRPGCIYLETINDFMALYKS